jgi:predicted nucleic acid-binding protein
MSGPAFLDTNIFVYSDDASQPLKQAVAIRVIQEKLLVRQAIVSLQVMQEYFAVVTRKLGVLPEVAQPKVEVMARMRVVRFGEADVISAIGVHRLHRISFWNSMIVHAAKVGGAEELISEDLNAGSSLAGVRVVNPFV